MVNDDDDNEMTRQWQHGRRRSVWSVLHV